MPLTIQNIHLDTVIPIFHVIENSLNVVTADLVTIDSEHNFFL